MPFDFDVDTKVLTPIIDNLASNGIVFYNALCRHQFAVHVDTVF